MIRIRSGTACSRRSRWSTVLPRNVPGLHASTYSTPCELLSPPPFPTGRFGSLPSPSSRWTSRSLWSPSFPSWPPTCCSCVQPGLRSSSTRCTIDHSPGARMDGRSDRTHSTERRNPILLCPDCHRPLKTVFETVDGLRGRHSRNGGPSLRFLPWPTTAGEAWRFFAITEPLHPSPSLPIPWT